MGAGFSAENLVRALQSIHAYRMRLETEGEHVVNTAALIDRVDLGLNELQLTLNLAPLVNHQFSNDKCGALKMKRSVAMQLRRRGVELRIIMAGETAARPRFEPTLIKAIGRGRRWFAELACNRAQDTAAIAQREGVHDSYARRSRFSRRPWLKLSAPGASLWTSPPRVSRAELSSRWLGLSRKKCSAWVPPRSRESSSWLSAVPLTPTFDVTPPNFARERNRQFASPIAVTARSPVAQDSQILASTRAKPALLGSIL
ncbi:MAG: hypothetical protein ACLQBA_12995 [Candidatus Binataceae bacterium]